MKCVIELIFITILFVSCQKSEEDKLYGRWQFRDCEYPTGETFTNDSIYYCFDRGVFELQKRNVGNSSATSATAATGCSGYTPLRAIPCR